ncbi:bifunctional phosphoribosyl-AMP cyclohydrolase/phosphoribosyl-ATP diphosphatase HisIE [Flavobacteriaceae bacterium]|jgi:phosphoribosyl-ATP pyrophosphohydrolase/phosphoribosyl-AMP cyclohydrolase|nr:bifunctional phosphoribosyl-AMP cyclohydrolase/phosphoribosyl-ATP diphosphatase HisIE [Flavobacteriaceae bacterium]|tara:strand:- start:615 stop:1211 length:597 start_codon:yes stop_codon:yes gene_type:complete
MELNFSKNKDGLIPVIIQDSISKTVLMLGYMNDEAIRKTKKTGNVTFYSRTKKRLWTKGEESGNFLRLVNMKVDCDNDTILIYVKPEGPTCHLGTDSCWGEKNLSKFGYLSQLEEIIAERKKDDKKNSYVASLFREGINKIAQKVGEEATETIIEAKDENKQLFLNESADLLFHYLILLQAKGFRLSDVEKVLLTRKR